MVLREHERQHAGRYVGIARIFRGVRARLVVAVYGPHEALAAELEARPIVLFVRIIVLGEDCVRLHSDDCGRSQLDGQRVHCSGHQDLATFERCAEFVVKPSYRFHVRPE